jgi:hypothetical protein
MAGYPARQREKAAQEWLLRRREQRHIHRTLSATQHSTQGNHQQLMEVMQTGIAGSRLLQALPARDKLIQGVPHRRGSRADG